MDINFPFNDIKTDVYIGTSAGKMIQDAIDGAQSRIVILSPYVDSEMIEALAIQKKYKPNLQIKVSTSFEDELKKAKRLGRSKSIFKQFEQRFKPDKDKEHQLFWIRFTSYGVLAILIFTLLLAVLNIDEHSFGVGNILDSLSLKNFFQQHVFGFIESLLLESAIFIILSMISREYKTGSYLYKKRLDFSLFMNPHANRKIREELLFLHTKIYLIDQIVFLGSVNFTQPGFKNNVETRIKVTDSRFIQYIEKFLAEVESQKIWVFEEEKIRLRLLREGIINEHPNRPGRVRSRKFFFLRKQYDPASNI